MKIRKNFFSYLLSLLVIFLLLVSSCEKDNNSISSFTDSRDGNDYKTVTIGGQVWMAENLRYLPTVGGPSKDSDTTPCYYVYGYEGKNVIDAKERTNYSTYGVLYNWQAAKEACPVGWHLPSNVEWQQLVDYIGGKEAGGKLKETGTIHWLAPNTGATNETGFKALPGGDCYFDSTFYNVGNCGFWWSATELNSSNAWYWNILNNDSIVFKGLQNKEIGFSVRCIKD
jgi:uncharacterized protein (TIGR02145 family)